MLRFHAKTFSLLGIEPSVSPSAVELLDQVEKRIGRPCRHLQIDVTGYLLRHDVLLLVVRLTAVGGRLYLPRCFPLPACRLLLENSNDDPPVDISHFGEPARDSRGGGPHDLIARDLLLFRRENQGVCAWAICLDGSDDPPVVVDVDSQFHTWASCADSFSHPVYSWVWDYSLVVGASPSDDLLMQTENIPFSEITLNVLNNRFQPELVTHGWPGATQYRFFTEGQRILIWADEGYANWFLSASNEDELVSLITKLSSIEGLQNAMWSHAPNGQRILERLRLKAQF